MGASHLFEDFVRFFVLSVSLLAETLMRVRAYTGSRSTSPFCLKDFFRFFVLSVLSLAETLMKVRAYTASLTAEAQ